MVLQYFLLSENGEEGPTECNDANHGFETPQPFHMRAHTLIRNADPCVAWERSPVFEYRRVLPRGYLIIV